MPELGQFQSAFVASLAGNRAALAPWCAPDAPGLAVYANTIATGAVEALATRFPTVARITGTEWFVAAARDFAVAQPPASPVLHSYGAGFADWLAGFSPAADLPYLADIARLDAAWSRAYFAADALVLDAAALTQIAAADLPRTTLRLHPATTLLQFDTNIVSLWHAQQPPANGNFSREAFPEAALVTRRGVDILVTVVNADVAAFCRACAEHASLPDAAHAVTGASALADIIATAFNAAAFSALAQFDGD